MTSINKRLEMIEKTVEQHLIESGEIRSDLKWLKKSFWTLAGAAITFNVVLAGYLFNHFINH